LVCRRWRRSPLQRRQLGFYPRVATLILVIDLLVVATGWFGNAILLRRESASLAIAAELPGRRWCK